MRLTLTVQNGKTLTAELIYVFTPTDESRSDAPTFHAMAQAIFRTSPQISRVALLHSNGGALFFIIEAAHRWFDVKAQPVRVALPTGSHIP